LNQALEIELSRPSIPSDSHTYEWSYSTGKYNSKDSWARKDSEYKVNKDEFNYDKKKNTDRDGNKYDYGNSNPRSDRAPPQTESSCKKQKTDPYSIPTSNPTPKTASNPNSTTAPEPNSNRMSPTKEEKWIEEENEKIEKENLKKIIKHKVKSELKKIRKTEEENLRSISRENDCEEQQKEVEVRASSWKSWVEKKGKPKPKSNPNPSSDPNSSFNLNPGPSYRSEIVEESNPKPNSNFPPNPSSNSFSNPASNTIRSNNPNLKPNPDPSPITSDSLICCLLCQRRFPSIEFLLKHEERSVLHNENVLKQSSQV
jgi:hypothetical protein